MTDEQEKEILRRMSKVPSVLIYESRQGVNFQLMGVASDPDRTAKLLLSVMLSSPEFAQAARTASLLFENRKSSAN